MTVKCCATVCKSDENTVLNGEKVNFYQFPADKKLQQQWERICKTSTSKEKNDDPRSLCELHFDESSFDAGKQLKPDAVPKNTSTKRTAELIELDSNEESPRKQLKTPVKPETNKDNNKNEMIPSGDNIDKPKSQSYRLTIQIDKIYQHPCPKSKKKKKIKEISYDLNPSQVSQKQTDLLNGLSSDDNVVEDEVDNHNCVQCLVCKKSFTNTTELYVHVKSHFTCDICRTEFTSRKSYEKHYNVHKSNVEQYPYKCHICDLHFDSKDLISKHSHIALDNYKDNSAENRIQYCKSCNMTFRNESTFRKHLNSHVAKASVSFFEPLSTLPNVSAFGQLVPITFSCRICNQSFANVAEIDLHTKTHVQASKQDNAGYII